MDKDSNKRLLLHNPLVNGLFWGCLAATIVFMAIACAIAAPYDTFASFLDVKTAFLANIRFRVFLSLSIVAAFGWLTVLLITVVDNIIQLCSKRPQVSTQQEDIVPNEIATPDERPINSNSQPIIDEQKLHDLFVDSNSDATSFIQLLLNNINNQNLFKSQVDYGRVFLRFVDKHKDAVNNNYTKVSNKSLDGKEIHYGKLIDAFYEAIGINAPSKYPSNYDKSNPSKELSEAFKGFI